jgi:quercetin dioxygenase-like cupin family protein
MQLDVAQPVLLAPGGGEVIGDAPDRRVEILSDVEQLNATWSRFGPRREGADLHVHRHHTDMFYVLDGELSVRLGPEDRVVTVPAGTLARVPPLVVHGFRNGTDSEVRYLNLHAPGQRFADYLRAMRDGREFSYDQHEPPADGGRPSADAVAGGEEVLVDRPGLRVVLLADVDEIGISEASIDPGGPSPPQHLHRGHVESFYVLSGELAFTVGGRELRAGAGSWVQVPPGIPHTFDVAGDRAARFLNLHTPSRGYGAFLRALHRARDEDELAAARAAFDQIAA